MTLLIATLALSGGFPVHASEDYEINYQTAPETFDDTAKDNADTHHAVLYADNWGDGFVNIDDDVYYYNFDQNGNPYILIDSEVFYLALPLEHLRVTDNKILEELDKTLDSSMVTRSVPGSYYDISDNDSSEKLNSSIYSASVDFDQTATFTTPVLKVNRQHATVRFKTTDIKKTFLRGQRLFLLFTIMIL